MPEGTETKNDVGLSLNLRDETKGEALFENTYDLPEGKLAVAVSREGGVYRIILRTDISGPLLMHWGVAVHSPFEWTPPPESIHPEGTVVVDGSAAQTPFVSNRLDLLISEKDAPLGISFVLKNTDTGAWLKNHGQNFYIPVKALLQDAGVLAPRLSYLAGEIIHAEMDRHSWTLMHRFNLCHDLLDRVRGDIEGLALLFVWMRYSAVRQLDWQRDYNTKPAELSHAQDRLTLKLARIYISEPETRELVRLIMTTLGRGGEGQRVRDEILKIMHRHRIKEVSGHFIEEWHQKLHNNTTPDDIVICEAYLNFLRSDGDLGLFYKTLEAGGVTKERLESFDRPIVTPPDFVPHLKEGLIHDFENYLRILKSVHSGTDLEIAAHAAGYLLDGGLREIMDFILQHRDDTHAAMPELAAGITTMRNRLAGILNSDTDHGRVRDMLYLDLALEQFLRVVVERGIHMLSDRDQLVELTGMAVENMMLSYDNPELPACLRHWQRLKDMPRFSRDWSLHAKSVTDRLGRIIGDFSEHYYRLFQAKAEFLGRAFHADSWVINLFTEEVVRGRPAFVLSTLIRRLDPLLRGSAGIGDWQVISPGRARGYVEVVDELRSVQGRAFDRPTVIVTDRVSGDEEPPEGVNVVITPDPVDLVSHVAVRARNARLLFATCYDRERYERLKSLKGHLLDLAVNTAGDVVFEEVTDEMTAAPPQAKIKLKKIDHPGFTTYAVHSADFREGLVGGKSNNLRSIMDRLPEWIHLPPSAALPFGVFEHVLELDINRDVAARYTDLLSRVEDNPEEILAAVRKLVLELRPPDELLPSLRSVMEQAGLGWPENPEDTWTCIKRVWASKWNERAYLSRRARGIPHEDVFMAVIIQQVVEAEYAFVIHTANPFTGDRNELYAEVVAGLGETLVGNYPGRALSFTSGKDTPEPHILSYPGKSTGLYGSGLIFRSDSNAEDLAEYAGAGLYDSVMLNPPREVTIDYTDEPLVWDEDFRRSMLSAITEIGIIIEKAAGLPQDIEGAYAGGLYYAVQTRPQM
ncbi:MAG: hypothetical protein GXP46_00305 [Deferribacteres bacterium]|nr:hypothetical protein [Deferribacteres bacterium]